MDDKTVLHILAGNADAILSLDRRIERIEESQPLSKMEFFLGCALIANAIMGDVNDYESLRTAAAEDAVMLNSLLKDFYG